MNKNRYEWMEDVGDYYKDEQWQRDNLFYVSLTNAVRITGR